MSETTPIADRLAAHVAALPPSGIREFFELVQGRPDVISSVSANPISHAWHIREATIYALERGRTSYTSNYGLMSLREEISKYVARLFGPVYRPDNEILITVGVSEALDLALRALIDPGDEVIYHEPCYVSTRLPSRWPTVWPCRWNVGRRNNSASPPLPSSGPSRRRARRWF